MQIVPWTKKHENPQANIYPPKNFQVAWYEALEDPYIEKIVLKKSARVGYAIFINGAVGWIVTNAPGNIMISQNTEGDAEKFAVKEIGKVLNNCPAVSKRLFGKNTSKEKSFYGGEISIVWATSGSSFRMATIRYLFLDETSGYPDNVDNEGGVVDLATVRTETESKRKIVLGSTPKESGTCKISRDFEETDQRYLYIPCPHCGHEQRLKLENFRYAPSDYKTAHFVCESCTGKICEHHKYEFMQHAKWRATRKFTCCNEAQEPNIWDRKGTALCKHCGRPGDLNERGKVDAGFHIWSAYNDNPNTAFPSIASEYDKAKKKPEKMQAFMNTRIGTEYSEHARTFKIKDFEQLYNRREVWSNNDALPFETIALLASVDTQVNRFEYHFWAVGKNGECWAVEYGAIFGDPEFEETQQNLINKLSEEKPLKNGRVITAHAVVMDCNGHAWKAMLEFVLPYTGWIYAIRGDSTGSNKFKSDFTLNHSTHKEVGCEFRTLNVHQLKNKAAERLNLEAVGKNYIHFPVSDMFNLNYFQMLTAEHLIGSGSNIKWDKKPGQKRNEPFDLLVYFLWLLDFLRPVLKVASTDEPLGIKEIEHKVSNQEEHHDYSDDYETSDYEAY